MLQRSVVDRWVQSDHISLKHPCPETLLYALGPHLLPLRLTGDIYLTFLQETLPELL
jgi:hypothetical protein